MDHFVNQEIITLQRFVARHASLRQENPTTGQEMQAARFALCGKRGETRWARLSLDDGALGAREADTLISRDYDSLIGFTGRLDSILTSVTYYPNPNPTWTLDKSIFVPVDRTIGDEVRRLLVTVTVFLTWILGFHS